MVSSWIDIPNKSLILSLRFFLPKNLIIPGISLCDLCQYFISIIQEDRRTGHWLQHKWWTQLSSLRGCPRAIEKRKWGLTESFLYVFIVKSFYCFGGCEHRDKWYAFSKDIDRGSWMWWYTKLKKKVYWTFMNSDLFPKHYI